MNRLIWATALSLSMAVAAFAGGVVKTKTPAQAVAALMSFKPPKNWSVVAYANSEGADPVLRFENLADTVQILVFGSPGSNYRTPKDFPVSPSEAGTVTVAGKKLTLYRRRFPIEAADPHRPSAGKSLLGSEVFCILPLKNGRFAVLAYRRASPMPDLHQTGEKAWAAFLKTVTPTEP